MRRFLIAWAVLTALGCVVVYRVARIDAGPMPSEDAQRWALATLAAAWAGEALPPAPEAAERFQARGPVIGLAWAQGRVRARHAGTTDFADSVRGAAAHFAGDSALRALQGADAAGGVHFTLSVGRGSGPFVRGIPFLENLALVPLREGAAAELGEQRAYVTPDEILAEGLLDHVVTPIPDLTFGVDLEGLEQRLADRFGVSREQLRARGSVRRFRASTIAEAAYPRPEPVDRATLERAARQGAEFLLRHQHGDGRYTYVYRAGTGREADARYNLPRHAGTTYFLAQAARVLDLAPARWGAKRALRFLRRTALRQCGAPDRLCIADGDYASMGSAALAALASAELLRSGDDRQTRELLRGLTRFIRSMQRPDGELMHIYDLREDRPLDIQKMYYSGEAAYALLASYRVLGDPEDLAAARRLMRHLTGAGWSFFGSRYFYGEEHWTCQSVAQAAELAESTDGLDFCSRWLAFQRKLLYGEGQTPWPVQGAIGVGPLLLPRLTTVASRTETAAMFYPVAKRYGLQADAVRRQVEANLGFLLRMRWAPGPAHLFFDPEAAFGGVPGSPAALEVRNDYVQHAGSAMLLWAEVGFDEDANPDPDPNGSR